MQVNTKLKRKILASGVLLVALSSAAQEYSIPEKHWSFMDGYKYEYQGCMVGWNVRSATFSVLGEECERITSERMMSDALKSIEYVKGNSSASSFYEYYELLGSSSESYTVYQANQDAYIIWQAGCLDFKSGFIEKDFVKWLKVKEVTERYARIKNNFSNGLYFDGWETARLLEGVVSCGEISVYRVRDYTSGVDIRK